MDQRLNFGSEVRELKLGSTFTSGNNARTSFHTLKCKCTYYTHLRAPSISNSSVFGVCHF